jgi:tetratricopeptide (TPR) repeat protein
MNQDSTNAPAMWSSREAYLLAALCLMFGLVLGYLFRGSAGLTASAPGSASAAAPAAMPANAAPRAPLTAEALQPLAAPMLAAVKLDPKNFDALVQLGNLYFDHKVYPEAITWYGKALELRPNDVNVRTDRGTALWYTGDAKGAVADYEKSLRADPQHIQTQINLGVVRLNGLRDPAGAIAVWERLLKSRADFPERQHVLELVAQAKAAPKS